MASIADVSQQQDEITGQNGTLVNAMPSVDAEIQAFHEQIDQARNLTDIGAVIERLKCWVVANPHYRERTYPIFEQLYRREEGAKEAVAEAEKMGLSVGEQEQRERLFISSPLVKRSWARGLPIARRSCGF
jgi:hypothetical protein